MGLFVRITAVVAVAIVALIVLAFVLKIVLIAALVAALAVGGLAIYNVFRRRGSRQITYIQRR
ncbi:MAG TPA: hypothetical protein VGX96_17515 [Candidatus Elarobacter sp.]|jgi:hypothetical protein|nr:hypothetical protein [Candidatus Elarobacter sp.]